MGLRCSLFGHAYGDPVTERERERRGDEEVITTRKLRTCARCGGETVLSENKEVRHLGAKAGEPPAEDGQAQAADSPEAARSKPSVAEAGTDESEARESGEVADLVESAESDSQPVEDPSPAETSATDENDPAPSQSEDSGIIIDEGPESSAGDGTASETGADPEPAADTSEPSESASQSPDATAPEPESETRFPESSPESTAPGSAGDYGDETPPPPASEPPDEPTGAEALDDVGGHSADESRSAEPTEGGAPSEPTYPGDEEGTKRSTPDPEQESETDAWKEKPPATGEEAATSREDPSFQFGLQEGGSDGSTDSTLRGPAGIASEGPLDVDQQAEARYETLECPECGFSEAATSSLRAGDICPECHRGYLAGRR